MKHHILSLRTLLLSTAFWLPLLLLLAVTSCERRPLEVLIKEKVQIRVVMEWEVNYVQLYNEKPNGMTLRIWGSDNVPVLNQITNSDTVMVQLPPGTYYVMAYNELASEYAEYGMHFYDYNDYAAMTFRSSHYTRATNALGEGLPHLVPPEYPRIAVALDTVVITQDMVVEQDSVLIPYEEFEEKGYKRDYVYTRVLEFDEVPWPMTVDLKVALLVKHRDRLARVEGTISGMADGFYVTQVRRTSETASLWLDPSSERWRRAKYSDDADRIMAGSPFPLFTYGLNIGLRYKRWDFNFFLQGSHGNKIYNLSNMRNMSYSQGMNIEKRAVTSMKPSRMFSLFLPKGVSRTRARCTSKPAFVVAMARMKPPMMAASTPFWAIR